RFSGAQIQVTSKSGTNNIHGSAFFQAYRPGMNAYQRYNGPGFYNFTCSNPDGSTRPCKPSERGLTRNTQQFNQIGGSIGGPLWKDRLFAFFSYETERNSSKVTSTGWYETSAFDALAPSGSIASQFLGFAGAGVSSGSTIISETCASAGLVE